MQRPEIALSWHRAQLAGLQPSLSFHGISHQEVDRRSRLIRAATPVLDSIAENLAGTTFSVVLADRDARIVDRRVGQSGIADFFDALGITLGRQFTEDQTGTNAIATVHELRHGVTVYGDEHYADVLKGFSCYGHPIFHPATGRLDGILDITCPVDQATELLAPFLTRGVRDIERMLLEGAREAEQRLMHAFQIESARRRAPVLVLGEDVVLANPGAMELLDAADHAALRGIATDLPQGSLTHRLTLSSGRAATVRIEPVAGTGGVLFAFEPAAERRVVPRGAPDDTGTRMRRTFAEQRTRRERVLISGEPGTGRSTAARELAGGAPVAVLDAATVERTGPMAFESALAELLATHTGLLILEDVHRLPATVAGRVMRAVAETTCWIAATCDPPAHLPAEHASLLACFPARVELPALRSRREELPALISAMVTHIDPDAAVRCTPRALQVLAAHPWPGNLHELHLVVEALLDRRSAGDITPEDIPAAYRGSTAARRLAPIEQIEHDAIARALLACGGNKVQAAEQLGMSRSTFYRRLRTLGVTE
ncbi:sigma-54-dependent Fis family transcriptional regulator [Pseudonocardia sp. GCM10023141]|uniref:sigma-54-dependent Fis family transcriptional regulator n=1 Tax=Pseudonocardia sp. GCM10023141 TaxID=3252653 RepID=UPI0036175899